MTTHVMLDIESYGVRVGAVVLSAALVRFTDLAATTVNLSIPEQQALGLEIDLATHQWWGTQSPSSWAAATNGAVPLRPALEHLAAWLAWARGADELMLWCHGASFDGPLLQEVFRRAGIACPWSFRDLRCTRTLYELAGVDPRNYYVPGADHVALTDALGQAHAAIEALRRLAGDAVS